MAAAAKTMPMKTDVAAWLAAVSPPARRADGEALAALLAGLSGEPPVLWGASIIGFGAYPTKTGTWPRIGFSPRKAALVLYVTDGFPGHADLLARLGPHTTGVSCLYLKRLADVDMAVLAALVSASLDEMARRYPA